MPTFPGGIFAPTTKNSGDTIQPAHMNDVQAEITAIETALLNGITFPVSIAGAVTISTGGLTVSTGSVNLGGPSSLATLQVTGGSTLTTLTVTGGSTLASLVVTGTITVGGAVVAAPLNVRAFTSVNLNTANATWTALAWDTSEGSTGFHSTAANSTQFSFPSTGVWVIGANVPWSANGTGVRRSRLVLNGSTTIFGSHLVAPGAAVECANMVVAQRRITSTADFVTVEAIQNSGSTLSVLADSTTSGGASFWAFRVSA